MDKQKKLIVIVAIGFIIALTGWLLAAFSLDYRETGRIILIIGWIIGVIAIIANHLARKFRKSEKLLSIGLKICVIGFAIYCIGGLFEFLDMKDMASKIISAGNFTGVTGIVISILGVLKKGVN